MGTFKIEVEAVGGHGCQREVKDGEVVKPYCGSKYCPDCVARAFVADLQVRSNSITKATLRHWPDTTSEVQDDLVTFQRKGNF